MAIKNLSVVYYCQDCGKYYQSVSVFHVVKKRFSSNNTFQQCIHKQSGQLHRVHRIVRNYNQLTLL